MSITGAGSCTVTAHQAGNSNYNAAPDVSQSFSINKATLTVTADNKSRVFGNPNPVFTATISGFKYSETLATSGVTGTASCSTTATATSVKARTPSPAPSAPWRRATTASASLPAH